MNRTDLREHAEMTDLSERQQTRNRRAQLLARDRWMAKVSTQASNAINQRMNSGTHSKL